MVAALLGSWSVQSVADGTTLVVNAGATIPVGSKAILAVNRAIVTGGVTGATPVVDASGNTWTLDAASVRASTHDLQIWSTTVTTAITSATAITITWTESVNRKAAVLSAWSGVGARLATSGTATGGAGTTSTGANGSSATPAATTSAAAVGLVIGATSISGNVTSTPAATSVGSVSTAAGSSDRGVTKQYKTSFTSAPQSISATLGASKGWAAAVAVYAADAPPPGSVSISEWNGASEVPLTISEWNGASEVPLTFQIT